MKKLFQSKGGHSIWRDGHVGYVIADMSGATPDATDDGILYIDRSRKPVAQEGYVWLPLKTPEGKKVSTVTSPEIYRWLRTHSWRGKWAVRAMDCPYCGDST